EPDGGPRVSGPPNTVADTPRGFRLPVGTIAFIAALYSAGYYVWEQSHWGSQAVRDLVGNVAFMPFNLTVLVLFALASRNEVLDPAVRRSLRLLALGGGGVAIWYFSVRPTAASQESNLVVTLLAFAYPLASMLVLLGVTTVLLRQPIDGNRWAFGLLVTGVSVGVVADLTFNLVQLKAGSRSASWADAVFLVCYLMLIASGERYWRRPVAGRETPVPAKRLHAINPLPYLAVGTTYVLLLVVALRPWTDPTSGLAVGALLVTGLVVMRQLLTVRQNVRLLAEHAARQNEARFRSLVQHSSDVIIVTRADG